MVEKKRKRQQVFGKDPRQTRRSKKTIYQQGVNVDKPLQNNSFNVTHLTQKQQYSHQRNQIIDLHDEIINFQKQLSSNPIPFDAKVIHEIVTRMDKMKVLMNDSQKFKDIYLHLQNQVDQNIKEKINQFIQNTMQLLNKEESLDNKNAWLNTSVNFTNSLLKPELISHSHSLLQNYALEIKELSTLNQLLKSNIDNEQEVKYKLTQLGKQIQHKIQAGFEINKQISSSSPITWIQQIDLIIAEINKLLDEFKHQLAEFEKLHSVHYHHFFTQYTDFKNSTANLIKLKNEYIRHIKKQNKEHISSKLDKNVLKHDIQSNYLPFFQYICTQDKSYQKILKLNKETLQLIVNENCDELSHQFNQITQKYNDESLYHQVEDCIYNINALKSILSTLEGIYVNYDFMVSAKQNYLNQKKTLKHIEKNFKSYWKKWFDEQIVQYDKLNNEYQKVEKDHYIGKIEKKKELEKIIEHMKVTYKVYIEKLNELSDFIPQDFHKKIITWKNIIQKIEKDIKSLQTQIQNQQKQKRKQKERKDREQTERKQKQREERKRKELEKQEQKKKREQQSIRTQKGILLLAVNESLSELEKLCNNDILLTDTNLKQLSDAIIHSDQAYNSFFKFTDNYFRNDPELEKIIQQKNQVDQIFKTQMNKLSQKILHELNKITSKPNVSGFIARQGSSYSKSELIELFNILSLLQKNRTFIESYVFIDENKEYLILKDSLFQICSKFINRYDRYIKKNIFQQIINQLNGTNNMQQKEKIVHRQISQDVQNQLKRYEMFAEIYSNYAVYIMGKDSDETQEQLHKLANKYVQSGNMLKKQKKKITDWIEHKKRTQRQKQKERKEHQQKQKHKLKQKRRRDLLQRLELKRITKQQEQKLKMQEERKKKQEQEQELRKQEQKRQREKEEQMRIKHEEQNRKCQEQKVKRQEQERKRKQEQQKKQKQERLKREEQERLKREEQEQLKREEQERLKREEQERKRKQEQLEQQDRKKKQEQGLRKQHQKLTTNSKVHNKKRKLLDMKTQQIQKQEPIKQEEKKPEQITQFKYNQNFIKMHPKYKFNFDL